MLDTEAPGVRDHARRSECAEPEMTFAAFPCLGPGRSPGGDAKDSFLSTFSVRPPSFGPAAGTSLAAAAAAPARALSFSVALTAVSPISAFRCSVLSATVGVHQPQAFRRNRIHIADDDP
jgi:hypothetical protein